MMQKFDTLASFRRFSFADTVAIEPHDGDTTKRDPSSRSSVLRGHYLLVLNAVQQKGIRGRVSPRLVA
jgi:hypothetical protein